MKYSLKIIFLTIVFTILLSGSVVFANNANDYENDPQAGREQGYGAEKDTGNSFGISSYSLSKSLTNVSPYTGKTYDHNSAFSDTELVNGIDVSSWNGDIDWDKVAADGIEYAIIRVGYRGYGSGEIVSDTYYKENIEGALNAGVKVGAYFFTQAITENEAIEEANYILDAINGYDVEMPVVIDFEYASGSSGYTGRLYEADLSVSKSTKICAAFADTVEQSGYNAMIYANKSTLSSCLDAETLASKYRIWLANYTTGTTYAGAYDFWQYSESGTVNGISGGVDCDFWYDDGTIKSTKVSSTKITLGVTSKTLLVGKSFTLKYVLAPSDTTDRVTFKSSKPYVAYVTAGGYVKAISKGAATITATTTSGLVKKCKVIVNEDLEKYEIAAVPNQEYSGKAIKPSVTVQRVSKVATSAKTTSTLNMRNGPATSYSVLVKIPSGQKVNILGSIKVSDVTWYAVSVKISGTTYKGYCSGTYLKVTKTYKTLTRGTHYSVKYTNNKSIGKATVTVSGLDNGTACGTIKTTFKICPKKITSIKKVSVTKKSVKIKWSKKTSGSGYQIYRKTGKSGTYKLIKTIKKNTTATFKNTGLKKNTTYYYKVRTYKTINGKKYYGAFSKVLKVKTKK